MRSNKKFLIELPLKVALTEDGASNFISHNKKLMRFKLADNVEEYGIALNTFSPQSIQNMILLDYISKIEISMPEFISSRQDVMDLCKVIVFSILYKQFDREVYSGLIQCECVKKHNRANPAHIIDERTTMSDRQLRTTLQTKENAIQSARKMILDPIWKSIMCNKEYSDEEKNIYILMSEKFLNRLGLMNWYIITLFTKSDGANEMYEVIRRLLSLYMEKSVAAEYISILTMELALGCENTNIRKEAKKMYHGVDDIEALVLDPTVRGKIVEELQRKHELVFLSWKLGGGSSSIGKQGRLSITLYNKDDEFQEVKENIETAKNSNTNKKTLIDFYRELPEGADASGLGNFYFNYLEDACKKVNIKFESLVNQFSASDLTVINLNFNF